MTRKNAHLYSDLILFQKSSLMPAARRPEASRPRDEAVGTMPPNIGARESMDATCVAVSPEPISHMCS